MPKNKGLRNRRKLLLNDCLAIQRTNQSSPLPPSHLATGTHNQKNKKQTHLQEKTPIPDSPPSILVQPNRTTRRWNLEQTTHHKDHSHHPTARSVLNHQLAMLSPAYPHIRSQVESRRAQAELHVALRVPNDPLPTLRLVVISHHVSQ